MKYFLYCLAVIFILSLNSCGDNPNTPTGYVFHLPEVPFFKLPSNVDWSLVNKHLLLYREKEYNKELGTYEIKNKADAYFYSYEMGFIDAGTVHLNTDTIFKTDALHLITKKRPVIDLIDKGVSYFQDYPVAFDNTQYNWKISGSKNIDSFSMKVTSPQYTISLISPQPEQEIDINNDLTVSWNFSDDKKHETRVLISDNKEYLYQFETDTTFVTITKEYLQKFDDTIYVSVLSGNYNLMQNEDLYYSLAGIFSSVKIPVKLKK